MDVCCLAADWVELQHKLNLVSLNLSRYINIHTQTHYRWDIPPSLQVPMQKGACGSHVHAYHFCAHLKTV